MIVLFLRFCWPRFWLAWAVMRVHSRDGGHIVKQRHVDTGRLQRALERLGGRLTPLDIVEFIAATKARGKSGRISGRALKAHLAAEAKKYSL